jgi:hypothetical protein
MKKYLLLLLMLITGCGDDLGWDGKSKKDDCGDSAIADAGSSEVSQSQDVTETKDEQVAAEDIINDAADATETDVLADSGSDDAGVSVPDSVTGEDAEDTQDAEDVPEEVTQDVAPPPECVTNTDCDDKNLCTDDVCQADKCVHLPNTITCVDGDGCTVDDACKDGVCVAGTPYNCDDGNVCTDDSCEPLGKDEMHVCKHLPNAATCTDDNVCSLDDQCDGTNCKSKSAAICDDTNICTNDSCDPVKGCVFLANDVTCTDNNTCTVDDKCAESVCKAGPLLSCADNNDCTTDLCKPETGCYYDNNQNVCSDSNVCSIDDKCEAGICIAGPLKSCDDANLCTVDSCDAVDGCKAVNAVDGTKCAEGICQNGACACVSGFGCATPSFTYSNDTNAGMLGGMGGNVAPKMGCGATDVLVGLGFDFSNGQKTATRTTVVCGKVTIEQNGTVVTTQTTTQKSGGSGCFGWDPSTATPLVVCKSGWAVVGIKGKNAGNTLFNSVKVVCGKLDVAGKPTGETEELAISGMVGTGTDKEVLCPSKTIARYFETRAGCGQDALTMYCATATPDCTGQELICKDL